MPTCSCPAGTLAGDRTLLSLKAIATRTFGLTRLHLNGAWTFGTSATEGPRLEAPPRWFAGAAVDYTFFRSSLLLVGEVTASQDYDGAPVGVIAGAGARWQWTPTLVLDAGVARRLTGNAGPDLEVTAGLSHAFADAWTPAEAARGSDTLPPASAAVLSPRAEQFYYPGNFNWRFLSRLSRGGKAFQCVRLRPCYSV